MEHGFMAKESDSGLFLQNKSNIRYVNIPIGRGYQAFFSYKNLCAEKKYCRGRCNEIQFYCTYCFDWQLPITWFSFSDVISMEAIPENEFLLTIYRLMTDVRKQLTAIAGEQNHF